MENKTVSNRIMNIMLNSEKGIIFTVSDFYNIGSYEAVRKSLSRLTNDGKIYRLIDGYYTIPYYIESVQEYSYPEATELANKIALKYSWNIIPCSDIVLNQMGLSTQVPNVCEYLSDGPYREFNYLNQTIKFKHSTNRTISKFSKPLSLVIQSIKAIGKENITEKQISIIAKFCKENVKEDILKDTKSVPIWVYEIMKKINEVIING